MPASSDRVELPGSDRQLVSGHVRVGRVDPAERVGVTVYLRHRVAPTWIDEQARRPPGSRRRISRRQWAQSHGADPDEVNDLRAFAEDHSLVIERVSETRRTVELNGAADAMAEAFGVRWAGMYAAHRRAPAYRARTGPLTVPTSLRPAVVGILGIDDRPQAHPRIRFAAQPSRSYTPVQVAHAYGFPTTGAAGVAVGVVELGGGYREADLTAYFHGLGIEPPPVTTVVVDGGADDPGTDADADAEVMLDLEVIGAVAPGVELVVYFAPNTDRGFVDAVSRAVHDTAHSISALSISWGSSEDGWTGQARAQMESILTDAGGLGVTVCVAAGDGGSSDGATDGSAHVDFPASAPHALACGGTRLELDGAQITSETTWSAEAESSGATGGGVSRQFAVPAYQSAAHVPVGVDTREPGRGVPDVAGDADPDSGYSIRVDGAEQTIGGTSAVAPLWAGFAALARHALGAPLGFAQPGLYRLLGTPAFHDITTGSNGAYSAGPGWDACTGLGTPDGQALVHALGAPAARDPGRSDPRPATERGT